MSNLPNPLTPAECDLRGLSFMPLDVVRLSDSDLAALSTGDEFKAAVLLWCKSWLQVPAASLPDDDRVLAHLTGLGPKWRRVRPMALKGWVKCVDGRLYHPVIAEKAREAWKHRQAQRDRANKRWGNTDRKSTGSADDNCNGTADGRANGHATALPGDMQGTGTGREIEEKIASPDGEGSAEPTDPPLTVSEVVEAWNDRMVPKGFPAVQRLTGTRERHLKARIRENTIADFQRAMDALERSAFCRGENERGWRADFDFFVQPKSFTKLLEGAYDH